MSVNITLEELLESGAHFGHQAKRWNPKMAPFLYDVKDGVHIFDLAKTREAMVEALEFISTSSREGKAILIVGTKKQVKQKVADVALATNCMYVNERWLGGTLTNFGQILATTKKLKDLKEKMAKNFFQGYTKKEKLLLERKIAKMEKFFGGIADISKYPDVMIVIDTHKEFGAVEEARKLNIPTVAVVDSNADPNEVTYPIPMNDDASKALDFVMDKIQEAILDGKKVEAPKKEKKPKSAKIGK
jgi:small subunit ribosomal protein S2